MKVDQGLDSFLTLPSEYIPGKIGVVTVLYNSAPVLDDFFASIEAQEYTHFAVYCVDNASHDSSAQLCSQRGNRYVVVRNDRNLGVAKGNNQGISAAIRDGCEFVLLLNNDVVFEKDLFGRLLDGMRFHQADMTTPLCYYYEPRNRVWCAGGGFNRWAGNRQIHYGQGATDDGQFNTDKRVEYSPTCCVLIKRALFERVGLMDERYFVYWDDTDWMLRAGQAGASLWFLHTPKLWHKVSSLTGKSSDFSIRFTRRNHAYYFLKHMGWLRATIYSAAYQTYYLLCFLAGFRRGVARSSLRAWSEGLTLYRSARMQQKLARPGKPIEIVYGVFKGMGDLLNAAPVIAEQLNRGHRIKLMIFANFGLEEFLRLVDLGPNRANLEIVHVPNPVSFGAIKRFLSSAFTLRPDLIWISPHAPQKAASWKIPLLLWLMRIALWRGASLAGALSEPLSFLFDIGVPVDRELSLLEREYRAFAPLSGNDPDQMPPRVSFIEPIRKCRELEPIYDLLIHPGANAANRSWPHQYYPRLLAMIPAHYKIAVLGLPKDIEDLRQILPTDRDVQFLTGTLEEAITAIASSRLLFTMDSGNVHFANFLNLPNVAIFGKSAPDSIIGTWGASLPIYERKWDCQPCGRAVCFQKEVYCVNSIAPETVAGALMPLLQRAHGSTGRIA